MAIACAAETPEVTLAPGRLAMCVVAIILLMALDGMASTLLAVNRNQVAGSLALIPDQVSWLGITYLAAKLSALALAPAILARSGSWRAVIAAGLGLAVSTAMLGLPLGFEPVMAFRAFQGACGAVVLVSGQSLVFALQPPSRQPLLQAVVALPVVALPATLAPALHGWATDAWSWQALFLPSGAMGLLAVTALTLVVGNDAPARPRPRLGIGVFVALVLTATGLVYVLQKGARYDWFDHPQFVAACGGALLAFVGLAIALGRSKGSLFDLEVFRNTRFAFGFCATFAAGFVLFGSASAILSFAAAVLLLDPAHAGQMLVSSSLAVLVGLIVAGGAIQYARIPVELPIPIGIGLFVTGMWMLSHATPESGREQLAVATWFRGLGMGTLFISLTMMALGRLDHRVRTTGIALFNLGRQIGGLAGSAFVLTWLEWQVPAQAVALSQYLVEGRPAVDEAKSVLAAMLASRGVESSDSATAAAMTLARMWTAQSTARAFDTLFSSFVYFFLFAIPVLVAIRITLQKASSRKVGQEPVG